MRALYGLCLLLAACLLPTQALGTSFDFAPYAELLQRYLHQDAVIDGIPVNALDYAGWHEEQADLNSPYRSLLGSLAAFDPDQLQGEDEQKAFWINVYNLAAIKTILDHWPVDSIRSRKISWLGLPWKREAIVVGGRPYSLAQIEFKQLVDRFRDLRIHLAINCASVSCVDLRGEPYRAADLERQLREQGERLATQPDKGLRIDRERGKVWVSEIFSFDREHFDEWAGGPVAFLLPYVRDAESISYLRDGEFRLDFLDYDWTVNALGQSR